MHHGLEHFFLANMEKTHKARLEDLYTEMAFPEVW